MRYALGEWTYCYGMFEHGDQVYIRIFRAKDDYEYNLVDNTCIEIKDTGIFKFFLGKICDQITEDTECMYVMFNQNKQRYPGKIVIGGWITQLQQQLYDPGQMP